MLAENCDDRSASEVQCVGSATLGGIKVKIARSIRPKITDSQSSPIFKLASFLDNFLALPRLRS